MRHPTICAAAMAALTLAACSGGGANNSSGANASVPAAANRLDPANPAVATYRSAVECAGTLAAAKSIVGGVSMSKTGAEQTAYRAEEERRRGQARAMTAHAITLGAALGVSATDVEDAIAAHEVTFVQDGTTSTTMDQFAATVGAQANRCVAGFTQVPGLTP